MDNFFFDIKKTYSLINNSNIIEENELKIKDNTEKSIRSNYFTTKPQGIIIEDSYNNFLWPIRPVPRLDTNKCDFITLTKRFRELYLSFKSDFLPWHYVIELIGDKYCVFNTRPINIRFPKKHDDILINKEKYNYEMWDDETKKFINEKKFLIEEFIHICILGDTKKDVYPKNFYRVCASTCIKPFTYYFKLPQTINSRSFFFNIGSKINRDYLFKFAYS